MKYRFMRFPGGKAKAVTLSYDDGCPEDIRFSDVITKAGLKCTFNLNSQKLREKYLSKEQVEKYFLKRGHEVAIHGALHRGEGALRPVEAIKDVLDCRIELEEKYQTIIRGMAYPDMGIIYFSNNSNYENIKRYLNDLDIVYARTHGKDNNSFLLPTDWHAWMPTAHHRNPEVLALIDEFIGLEISSKTHCALRMPRLFYLWGHSYEFERNNEWQLLDNICEKLAGHEEVWYATNIELYEYVNAYNSLIYSADGTIVFNPTLYEIWFDVDGKEYKIMSGETLKVSGIGDEPS